MKLALVLFSLRLAARIAAADPVVLDYHASANGCSDAARFADEVSTKLGFVPWSPSASASIYVRVERDGEHFTGSVRNRDGSAKIIDGASCDEVIDSLATSIAADLSGRADDKIAVTFAAADGGPLAVALRTGTAYGHTGKGLAVTEAYFEDLCTSPCTARVARGDRYLSFEADGANGGGRFTSTSRRRSRQRARAVTRCARRWC